MFRLLNGGSGLVSPNLSALDGMMAICEVSARQDLRQASRMIRKQTEDYFGVALSPHGKGSIPGSLD